MDLFSGLQIAIFRPFALMFVSGISILAAANPPLICGNQLTRDSKEIRENMNEAMGKEFVEPGQVVRGLWNETPAIHEFSFQSDSQLFADVIETAFAKMESKMVTHLATTLYTFSNPYAPKGTFANLEVDEIADRAASNFFCREGCASERERLSILAQKEVEKLVANGVARRSLAQIRQELVIDIQALNQLLAAVEERPSGWDDYQRHYAELSQTTVGQLLLMQPLMGRVGPMRMQKAHGGAMAHSSRFSDADIQKTIDLYYQYFGSNWEELATTTQRTIALARQQFSLNENVLDETHPVFWVAQYLAAAPLLMGEVFSEKKYTPKVICRVIQKMDEVLHSTRWRMSSQSAGWALKPLEIAAFMIPVFTAGAPLALVYAGVVALQLFAAYEIYGEVQEVQKLGAEERMQASFQMIGLTTKLSLQRLDELEHKMAHQEHEIYFHLALEVAAIGVAQVAHRIAHSRFHTASDADLASMLFTQGEKHSYIFLDLTKKMGTTRWGVTELRRYLAKLSAEEKANLFFGSRNLGFGRKLLLSEVATTAVDETVKISSKPLFPEINPVRELWDLFTKGPGPR